MKRARLPGEVRRDPVHAQVLLQPNYLHAVPQRVPENCSVCFGAEPYSSRCNKCTETQGRSNGVLADLVVPITYRGVSGQHAHDLRMYKQRLVGTQAVNKRLAALFHNFCMTHITCVKKAAGVASFSRVCFVPSTKRPGETHPLQKLLAPTVRVLRRIDLGVNTEVDPNSRDFHADWFTLPTGSSSLDAADVLLLDDTWVTGARAQSAAHLLKNAGARKVVVLVLARQVQPGYGQARPLMKRIEKTDFDPALCAVHDDGPDPTP